MKRVAIFGNAGGGKSTLARELAAITGLPLHVIDKIRFRPGGSEIPHEEYRQAHMTLLRGDEWIIDGFDSIKSAWERFEAADTLIHVDLPLMVHAWWVTKRLVKGLFVSLEGWPEDTPVIRSSISSYRVLWPCHSRLTPKYRSYVAQVAQRKRVFHLRSRRELKQFLAAMAHSEVARRGR
jgi:adenylate kinase family enzyme